MENAHIRTASLDALVEQNLPPLPRLGNTNRRIVTHHLLKDSQKWGKITHRFQTTQQDLKAPTGAAPADDKNEAERYLLYRSQSWNGNIDRLKAAGIDTTRLVEDHYEFCLPNSDNSRSELKIYDFLYLTPMLKTDQEISSIIPLEPSTPSSPPLPLGQHYYIRTWELTPEEFRAVINIMLSSGKAFPEVFQWLKLLDLFSPKQRSQFDLDPPSTIINDDPSSLPESLAAEDPSRYGSKFSRFAKARPQTYSVRYVGTVAGPRRPIDRFQEDLNQRKSGIMHEFLQVLEDTYPLVFDAGRTSLIKHASLVADATDAWATAPGPEIHRYNGPSRERFLIQYFGHETLLNRMYGGWYTDYVPPYDDEERYKSLNVVVYHDLLANGGTLDSATFTMLKSHWNETQDFAMSNSGSTGACRYKYTDAIRNAGFQQSVPYVYRNEVVLFVIIGKDITLGDYLEANRFFDGKSQAATLVRNFLHRSVSYESQHAVAFDERAFPFVNLWRWRWHRDFKEAIRLLQEYLQIIRPLITMSLSTEVNEIVQGDFTHTMDFPDGYITYTAGVPTIQYYDDQDKTNSAFINVPQVHPGRDKYTSQNKPLRRVFDMSYQASLLLGQVATGVIDGYLDDGNILPNRQKLCKEILAIYSELGVDSEPHQSFLAEFEAARLQLSSYRPTAKGVLPQPSRGVSDNYRLVVNAEGRMKLMSFGQAEGEPDSERRDRQLELLWKRDIPVLHTNVKRLPQLKQKWKDQFFSLPADQYFLLKVFSQMPPHDFMEGILKHVRPDLEGNTDWLTESPARTDAILACGMWLALPKKQDGGELMRMYRHFPRTYASAYDMQGRPVGVGDSGKIRLHWQKDENLQFVVNLRCMAAVPGVGEGNFIRCVQFTEAGIDIVDGEGDPFRKEIRKGVFSEASIERKQLLTSVGGQDLLDLWIAVREAHGHPTATQANLANDRDTTAAESVKDWGHVAKGVGLISHAAKTEKPLQSRPPAEGDALYPLDQYLRERFPEGGDFRTADPARVPDSTGDLQGFFVFIERPEWRNHPHADSWRTINIPNSIQISGYFKQNLRILRSINPVAEVRRNASEPAVKETYFEIGAPDTADPDPFSQKLEKATTKKAQLKKAAGTSKPSSSKAGKKHTIDEVDDDELPARKRRPVGSRGGFIVDDQEDVEEEEEDAEEEEVAPPKKRGASKAKGKEKQKAVADDDDDDGDEDEDAMTSAPRPATKKRRLRKKKAIADDDEEMLDLD